MILSTIVIFAETCLLEEIVELNRLF